MSKEIFSEESDNKMPEIPKEKRRLETKSYDYSVSYVNSLMGGSEPKIILEVPFQRKFIWKSDRSSQLIESLIMNVPIPPLYFAEENSKWLVIDGLQRLNSIRLFYQNEFGLKGLEIVKELEGLRYADLPPKPKGLLDDGLLRFNVLQKESHEDIKFDVFMRLNKGAVTLNDQELRNCLYRGQLINLAKKLSKNHEILEILGLQKPHTRFLDVEFILRYFAFSDSLERDGGDYFLKGYAGSLKGFLNHFLEKNKEISEKQLIGLENKLIDSLEKILSIFSSKEAFRDPLSKSKMINKALADCVLLSFERHSKSALIKKRTQIKRLLGESLENERFRRAISQRTSDTENVNFRLTYWLGGLEHVINS